MYVKDHLIVLEQGLMQIGDWPQTYSQEWLRIINTTGANVKDQLITTDNSEFLGMSNGDYPTHSHRV